MCGGGRVGGAEGVGGPGRFFGGADLKLDYVVSNVPQLPDCAPQPTNCVTTHPTTPSLCVFPPFLLATHTHTHTTDPLTPPPHTHKQVMQMHKEGVTISKMLEEPQRRMLLRRELDKKLNDGKGEWHWCDDRGVGCV